MLVRFGAGVCAAVLAAGMLVGGPAAAAQVEAAAAQVDSVAAAKCRHTYDSNGFPQWTTGCSSTLSPGRFGPLRMGRTSVNSAKAQGYLAYNRFCSRWDGYEAAMDWRSKSGVLTAWTAGGPTTKGLRASDRLSRGRALYPGLKRTGFVPNEYVDGEGWAVYSVRAAAGWLDWYRYNTARNRKHSFFSVRSTTVKSPVKTWAQDGC